MVQPRRCTAHILALSMVTMVAPRDACGDEPSATMLSLECRMASTAESIDRLLAQSNAPVAIDLGGMLAQAVLQEGTESTGAGSAAGAEASGSNGAADLAQKLTNPVASLISVPFQFNYDQDIGPNDDGEKVQLNFQPVIPISLNEEWNIISRTILPIIYQDDVFPGAGSQFGLGDTTQSFFFSPKKPTSGGLIWGAGPAFLIPTATEDALGSEKFGLGPTVVLLKQEKSWTYGALANHIWSVAGNEDRDDVNSTFLQPFLSYTTQTAWTFTLNTESTYDWEHSEWSVPLNFQVSKVLKFGGQPVSIGGGVRYWLDGPEDGPEGFGFRFIVTLLFPT